MQTTSAQSLIQWRQVQEQKLYDSLANRCTLSGESSRTLAQLVLLSDYAIDALNTGLVDWQELLFATTDTSSVLQRLQLAMRDAQDDASFAKALRRARALEQVRLIARDAIGLDYIDATLAQSSAFADASLQVTLDYLMPRFIERFGTPRSETGEAQSLCIFGLGKLGGHELNFSSDIDLIFAFPEAGQTDGARSIDNEDFFARLGQKLIPLLSEVTQDGFVHRVDMRLRPFGAAGRLALSFAGMEQYYQRDGRDWERYAWIKARCVAGDIEAGKNLIQTLRPFVYRKYLDYTAIEGLREMKALIDVEVEKKEMHDNLKLGPGGIREIEFVVQLAQMIRGGREPLLRTSNLLQALSAANELGHFSADEARELNQAYHFLRLVENRVQMLHDQQTHSVPEAPIQLTRIALGLGFESNTDFIDVLDAQRARVAGIFARTLRPEVSSTLADSSLDWSLHFQSLVRATERELLIDIAPYKAETLRQLFDLIHGANLRARNEATRARVMRLMPLVLDDFATETHADLGLMRFLHFIQAVAGRPSYLALLAEHRGARARVCHVFARAGLLAERITRTPILLDELIDARLDSQLSSANSFSQELARRRSHIDVNDTEEWIVALQEERDAVMFRLGLAVLDQRCSALDANRVCAEIGELILREVLQIARNDIAKRNPLALDCAFAIAGYGSLGGRELGFASDLDLVFLFGDSIVQTSTDETMALVARLAQRVLHWLNTTTRAGRLYEVDMRLRPDGAKGLLVTSVASFSEYQTDRAWLWEHQALLRSRVVCGTEATQKLFESQRDQALRRKRDQSKTRQEIASMRARWRKERDRSKSGWIDLKQAEGALVDIEFIAQAQVLIHAHGLPSAQIIPSSTSEVLALALEQKWINQIQANALNHAHQLLAGAAMRQTLNAQARLAPISDELKTALDAVKIVWQEMELNQPV